MEAKIKQCEAQVLVVDDDVSVRSFLRRGLSLEGYAVEEAETGEQGLELARLHRPDLIVLDLMLPQMDGFQTLSALRAHSLDCPVILLSADDSAETCRAVANLGITDFMVKPISFAALTEQIEQLLRGKALN